MQDRRGEAGHLTGEPGIAVQRIAVPGESVDQGLVLAARQGDPGVGFTVGELGCGRALSRLATEAAVTADHQCGERFGDLCSGGRIALPTREDQALIYRLSGDRNPLHSDPWFAREMAGFPTPILHGLCTYGFAGRALLAELAGGQAARLTAVAARFSAPVFPGETLTTSIWRTGSGRAVYRTEASGPDGSNARVVLDDGVAEYKD